MEAEKIAENARQVLAEIPENVIVVAAAKTRTALEVKAVAEAGITHIGHNYVQEAQAMRNLMGVAYTWHMIGHIQANKTSRAVRLFDVIETVDSVELAEEIDKTCAKLGKVMPVFIEVNSGREENKAGIFPETASELVASLSGLQNLEIQGLMTMGPFVEDGEVLRPYFKRTRQLFDELKQMQQVNLKLKYLSMGMSDSYLVAIEEGANIVRIGTKIFGSRT
ncbi:MAG: YggS family pyridoxal phosphate-dependent enzyme [Anaerolineales bacterium]|nr:YggS family pyridoxal phosphate-dependent enzyme [Anaerolineales bacterium]